MAGTVATANPAAVGTAAGAMAAVGAGSLPGPWYHFFVLFFAVNLHLYLLSGFSVPTKLAQCYAKSLGLTAQLRLSKSWAEAL